MGQTRDLCVESNAAASISAIINKKRDHNETIVHRQCINTFLELQYILPLLKYHPNIRKMLHDNETRDTGCNFVTAQIFYGISLLLIPVVELLLL